MTFVNPFRVKADYLKNFLTFDKGNKKQAEHDKETAKIPGTVLFLSLRSRLA